MCFPFKSVSDQLCDLLAQPGMEDLLDWWWTLSNQQPQEGSYIDIFNGHIAQSVLGSDGLPFFQNMPQDCNDPNGELRIGLTLGANW